MWERCSPRRRGWSHSSCAHPARGGCSPRRRGWSEWVRDGWVTATVLPAQAGVVRGCGPTGRTCTGAPRAGGGGPRGPLPSDRQLACSPRRRGWSEGVTWQQIGIPVLPAQAGVVRDAGGGQPGLPRAPRAGGGGPLLRPTLAPARPCSPRRRGWSGGPVPPDRRAVVLPAQAGVVRRSPRCRPARSRAPRAGGGGPVLSKKNKGLVQCSPRRRGWSGRHPRHPLTHRVLPAQAGVVRFLIHPVNELICAPRAGGGGPATRSARQGATACSPRRRGWSARGRRTRTAAAVLPAQAGVVRTAMNINEDYHRAPRAGGGGPRLLPRRAGRAPCSPRRRGWSGPAQRPRRRREVLPAQAGVVRRPPSRNGPEPSAPRAGGGGPLSAAKLAERMTCSPRRRGWSAHRAHSSRRGRVLPAQAGVVRCSPIVGGWSARAPRAGGGGPAAAAAFLPVLTCSPRRRGWSAGRSSPPRTAHVLPAQAGVVRPSPASKPGSRGAPRAGGGGPVRSTGSTRSAWCSPRRRGWSGIPLLTVGADSVLPAQAGVVRRRPPRAPSRPGAPRAGGGGPDPSSSAHPSRWCSPRRRGWSGTDPMSTDDDFVLPAQAGVVRHGLLTHQDRARAPRAGGGGPHSRRPVRRRPLCSPRRRGWSDRRRAGDGHHRVLPAQAGVVRATATLPYGRVGAPRAGGGGPSLVITSSRRSVCSPRRRGWSVGRTDRGYRPGVLPAQAGVVRRRRAARHPRRRAPRAGGGGPRDAAPEETPPLCSPRRRGWSGVSDIRPAVPLVLPAQAGVVRGRRDRRRDPVRAPRAGGGGPRAPGLCESSPECSPRRRGWSVDADRAGTAGLVLPAQAGVVRTRTSTANRRDRAPRAGGGGPWEADASWLAVPCSPRRRGWSVREERHHIEPFVLPAQAGVVRWSACRPGRNARAPRAGGGGPFTTGSSAISGRCSPRRRGWSDALWLDSTAGAVLPAQAGVVRSPGTWTRNASSAPRAGGGGPLLAPRRRGWRPCSPRRRGWSALADSPASEFVVLPAQAGVVRSAPTSDPRRCGAPRAGGGGPSWPGQTGTGTQCSPRRRGWSVRRAHSGEQLCVLPAQAGVVRGRLLRRPSRPCAPRAGGGGPFNEPGSGSVELCSPRRRGWSGLVRRRIRGQAVLPAQAGVVRPAATRPSTCGSAPRAGGGGPRNIPITANGSACSPRRRGWSGQDRGPELAVSVLPAQAGVVRGSGTTAG